MTTNQKDQQDMNINYDHSLYLTTQKMEGDRFLFDTISDSQKKAEEAIESMNSFHPLTTLILYFLSCFHLLSRISLRLRITHLFSFLFRTLWKHKLVFYQRSAWNHSTQTRFDLGKAQPQNHKTPSNPTRKWEVSWRAEKYSRESNPIVELSSLSSLCVDSNISRSLPE